MDEEIKKLARQIDVTGGAQSVELYRALGRTKLVVPIDQYDRLLELVRLILGGTVVAPSRRLQVGAAEI